MEVLKRWEEIEGRLQGKMRRKHSILILNEDPQPYDFAVFCLPVEVDRSSREDLPLKSLLDLKSRGIRKVIVLLLFSEQASGELAEELRWRVDSEVLQKL